MASLFDKIKTLVKATVTPDSAPPPRRTRPAKRRKPAVERNVESEIDVMGNDLPEIEIDDAELEAMRELAASSAASAEAYTDKARELIDKQSAEFDLNTEGLLPEGTEDLGQLIREIEEERPARVAKPLQQRSKSDIKATIRQAQRDLERAEGDLANINPKDPSPAVRKSAAEAQALVDKTRAFIKQQESLLNSVDKVPTPARIKPAPKSNSVDDMRSRLSE